MFNELVMKPQILEHALESLVAKKSKSTTRFVHEPWIMVLELEILVVRSEILVVRSEILVVSHQALAW